MQQAQHALRIVVAVALFGQEPFEELTSDRTKFRVTFAKCAPLLLNIFRTT